MKTLISTHKPIQTTPTTTRNKEWNGVWVICGGVGISDAYREGVHKEEVQKYPRPQPKKK
jgi:hypothetical protein